MKIIAAALLAAVLALSCAGCQRTITVTGKGRNLLGWYYVCDGTGSLLGQPLNPCRKYHEWRVPKSVYDQAVIGRTYRLN